jgi:hypothetical protein
MAERCAATIASAASSNPTSVPHEDRDYAKRYAIKD